MAYAFEGYCFENINAISVYLNSLTQYNGYFVKKPVILGETLGANGSNTPSVFLTLQTLNPTGFNDIATIAITPQPCQTIGSLKEIPFNPASLDTGVISQAFSAGFTLVTLPMVIAIGISTALKFLKGK